MPARTQVTASSPAKSALNERVDAYLAHLAVERRLSANTVESYRRDLLALTAWMGDNDLARFGDLLGEHLRSFIASEHRRGLSATSLQRRLSALRSFFQPVPPKPVTIPATEEC